MTTQDNAFRAMGTGNPHVDFFAIPGDDTKPAPIWGFLTRDNRFELVARSTALYTALKATAATPTTKGRLGRNLMTIRGTPACSARG
jgi:hypothetical protein